MYIIPIIITCKKIPEISVSYFFDISSVFFKFFSPVYITYKGFYFFPYIPSNILKVPVLNTYLLRIFVRYLHLSKIFYIFFILYIKTFTVYDYRFIPVKFIRKNIFIFLLYSIKSFTVIKWFIFSHFNPFPVFRFKYYTYFYILCISPASFRLNIFLPYIIPYDNNCSVFYFVIKVITNTKINTRYHQITFIKRMFCIDFYHIITS